MTQDTFSQCHPIVNFLYFIGAIGAGMLIQHPAYLVAGVIGAGVYYLLLRGRNGWRFLLAMVPMFLVLTAVNPLFNTYGATVLFYVFGRPYTLEALRYGGAVAAIFVVVMVWFGCYHAVMTSDKFTSLFGNLIPALSLVLVMVFRMVPNFIRKTRQIIGARRSIGKGAGETADRKDKLNEGMTVLSAMTSWALEGSVVTGDSMRARGYGCARRSSFQIYRISGRDWALLMTQILLLGLVITAACLDQLSAVYIPKVTIAPISWGIIPYFAYLMIPTVLHIKEAIQWHISRLKI